MEKFASAKRKNDVIITICQDNFDKTITIKGCNDNTIKILGYRFNDLIERDISTIFSEQTLRLINNYIDYGDTNYDIVNILSKIRDCKIVTKDKRVIDAKIKIFPALSEQGKIFCELLIRIFTFLDKLNKFRETTINYNSYHIAPELNIIDRDTTLQELNSLQQFHNIYGNESLVGSIILKSTNNLDVEKLKAIINAYEKCTREYDLIGHLGGNKLIFVILDCTEKNSSSIIERITCNITKALDSDKTFEVKYTTIFQHRLLINLPASYLK
ncbi:MAG: hypothetical protein HRK26_02450 [Rickettsiaceae bacterium H1]|nr:hypothetical protein [Rickettsiaceae bacterium H1]